MKVAISAGFGGFWLSEFAKAKIADRKGVRVRGLKTFRRENRTAPDLIAVVEELGAAASDSKGDIRVIEIPDSVDEFSIFEYGGIEIVIEEGHFWDYGGHYEVHA